MMTPALLRHALGDQRRTDPPFAADAEAGERAAHDELRDVADQGTQAGAEGVDRDRHEQRALAAHAIREPPEQHPAGCPAQKQHRGDGAGPEHRGGVRGGGACGQAEQCRDAVAGDEVEQQRVVDVEAPPRPAGGDDQPLVTREPEQSGLWMRHGISGVPRM